MELLAYKSMELLALQINGNTSLQIYSFQSQALQYKNCMQYFIFICVQNVMYSVLWYIILYSTLWAKRIEYILEGNLLEKSVKRPFCCTVSIIQVYFTYFCYIPFWALKYHFIENLKLMLKENQIIK